MPEESAARTLMHQRTYFQSGQTLDLPGRLRALKLMLQQIERYEWELISAVETDMDKAPYEVFMVEILPIYRELKYCIRHLRTWNYSYRRRRRSAFGRQDCQVVRKPYGVILVISNWSNPVLDALIPLIDAVGSGNCVLLKPSAKVPHVALMLKRILAEVFPEKMVAVLQGGEDLVYETMEARPDFVFFTGRAATGRQIQRAASRYLIPVALQLGGKSPCVVAESADIELAAQRIVWGKLLNAGQTGTAPDYVLAHDRIKTPLIEAMIDVLRSTYGVDPTHNPEYQRVSGRAEFDRIKQLMRTGRIMWGGRANEETLQIEPTIIDRVTWNSEIMQREVFGPILPVMGFNDFSDTVQKLNLLPHSLCFYLFSQDSWEMDFVRRYGVYGSCCINDTVMQSAYPDLPFGGVGFSGFGATHGRAGYELFTYPCTIVTVSGHENGRHRYPPFPLKWHRLKRFL